jgi:ribosomal-protein-alanine N-acetyltransferase
VNVIRAGSLILEPQVAAHAADMFTVLSDPAIYEFENAPPESLEWLERRFARLESRASANGEDKWLNWVIRLPSGALAGYVQATITRDRVAHIAYVLGSTFWRKGIGTAAVSAVLVELAATYAVHTAAATLKSRNYRSAAFLRSLDFSEQLPRTPSGLAHAPDELVLYKQIAAGLPPASMELQTHRLRVVLQTREEVERMIEAMSDYDRAQVSAGWRALLRASKATDPWVHAFRVVHRDTGSAVGSCGFKGPPVEGVVEIAYGIHPDHERNGYATEAAMALVEYAFGCGEVRLVRAHTLPGAVASQRVLTKCGFRYVGETVDPEDGTVCRFERAPG